MDQRKQFVLEWRSGKMSREAICRLFGISRQTGYKWARRFNATIDWDSLKDRSRRPLVSPRATPAKLVKLILSQRRQFPTWGPVPIRKRLTLHWPQHSWPSVSTIGAILKRNGKVKPRVRRRRLPPRTKPFGACRSPNDLWCVDFKGDFSTGDGTHCYPLTVMDGASRFLLACVAFKSPTLENVRRVFEELFRTHGLPKAIRSDNGEPFVAAGAPAGLSTLSAWWARLGIRLERIDPGKPQQNARHERMHLTLKIDTCMPPKRTLRAQQRAFDKFRHTYNFVRPHQALDLATPSDIYVPSSQRMPESLPVLEYPCADVYRVNRSGAITWGRRRLFISTALAGELIGTYYLDHRYTQVMFVNLILGVLDAESLHLGLIRPKDDRRRKSRSRVSAMSPV